MAGVTIKYQDGIIATMPASGTKVLETAGLYCDDDIEVEYVAGTISLQSKTVTPTTS